MNDSRKHETTAQLTAQHSKSQHSTAQHSDSVGGRDGYIDIDMIPMIV